MSVIIGNEREFDSLISSGKVLVDFYATWCGPCRMLAPVLEELTSNRGNLKVVKIDVDENRELAKRYGVMSIPTLILFKDGTNVSTKNGFMPKELLEDWINQY